MANPIKQLPKREIYQKDDFVERLHLNACYKTDEFWRPNFWRVVARLYSAYM